MSQHTSNAAIEKYTAYVMPTYKRMPYVFVKGKGSYLWDSEGVKYLDMFPGWGVSALGHSPKEVAYAVKKQSRRLIHLANNYYNEHQAVLAEKIIKNSFPGKVFFSNSGAESVEGAIKVARAWGAPKGKHTIITMQGSFHGRTLAALTATGQEKYRKGFEPLPGGFDYAEFNTIESVKAKIDDKTVAIMLELIQGEGGVNVADAQFVAALRKLCDEKDLLLICDEIQTGVGRTGKMFAFQHYGITPDVMTLAKGLAGGLPMGAVVAGTKVQDVLTAGRHASTFGGSPLCCAASLAVFDAIERQHLLEHVDAMGKYLRQRLERLQDKHSFIKKIKGMGLMVGMEFDKEAGSFYEACLKRRLLVNCTQEKIVRLLPALNVKKFHIKEAVRIMGEVLKSEQ
jgi:acetylornithine/N-succinyldiaminopimelate aminotransferase